MSERAVFCSYARRDAAAVATVVAELDRLGQRAWLDERLSGGQSWWDTILEHVRTCDCFLFALSDASLRSKACMAELDYAHRLGRSILPIAVGPVIDQLLPPYLAETQRVDAGDTHQLARALLSLPPPRPLPEPPLEPPPVPISYLDGLATQIGRDELTTAEQRNLEGDLKQRLGDPDEREAAAALLRRLRRHPSVNAWVAAEIDADLAEIESGSAPAKSPLDEGRAGTDGGDRSGEESRADTRRIVVPPAGSARPREPWDAPPRPPGPEPRREDPRWDGARDRRGGRGGLVAVLILVAVLAVAGVVVWAVSSGDDDTPPSQPVPTGADGEVESPGTTEETTTSDTTDTTDTTLDPGAGGDETGGSADGGGGDVDDG
jgi:hypothetical protein